ncbi:cilia- and flagella-associated protein 52-like [Paramacrobiotus metropolitanus]|uniref:cilia- and flagella-associated protein 52-like n=1 Tax=Paramacrobiotus metropolitanus TaxID=2943436 RepID=UPI0024464C6C|nr:cilia- and flagella-associated protein 52-like [Paramacrobiotus metropolitanus]XP_055336384.1 cilia- and flagella-associated protein 52-like [Paramacrobiotus metropolitanus]XP_055336385.1 cilia- and flagella-associated protein 52-like [Paramacrobiotus metropolitanus]
MIVYLYFTLEANPEVWKTMAGTELALAAMPEDDHDQDGELLSDSVHNLRMTRAIGFNGSVHDGLHVHNDGVHIIYPVGNSLIVFDTKTHKQTILSGHSNTISCVALSPSGRYIASGQVNHMGFKADVFVWDFATLTPRGRHALHKVKVEAVVFSENDKYCCSMGGQDDGSVVIYDVLNRRALSGLQVPRTVQGVPNKFVALNHRDDIYLAVGPGIIRVWEFRAEENRLAYRNCCLGLIHRTIETVKISPDDHFMLCGTRSGDIMLVELDFVDGIMQPRLIESVGRYLPTERQRQKESSWYANGVTALFLPNDRPNVIFLGTGNGWLYEARIVKSAVRDPIKTRHGMTRSEPNPKNVLDPIRSAQLHGEITSIIPVLSKKMVYVGTSASSIHRFDSENWANYELIFTANHGQVMGVAFPYEFSGVFATAGQDFVRLWSAVDGREMLRLEVPNALCNVVDFMQDGHSIVSAWSDGRIRAFSPESGRLIYEIFDAHPKSVTAMATTSDCSRIVTGGKEGQVRVWLVTTSGHKMLNSMHDHKGLVSCIRMNHDSTKCVSSSEDGTCVIWDLERYTRFQMVFANTLFKCVVFHPVGCQILTCGTDRKIAYWEAFNGQLCRHIYGSQQGAINALDITDDGKYIVTGGDERTVKIWRYHDGRLVSVGKGHSGTITALRISPDKKFVCSVSIDGAALQWDLAAMIVQDASHFDKDSHV